MEQIKAAFAQRDYIKEIVLIPSTYLNGGKGFQTLDQVARLHGVEVMALVSYDQVSNLTDTKAALLYWTIAGAYIIKGNKNEVQTFVDTEVFDMGTHKLLFRAPGISRVSDTTTLVDAQANVSKNSGKGFELAVADMNINLAAELDRFKERVKNEKIAQVTHTGGGSMDLAALLLLTILILSRRKQSRMAKR